jgi:adenine-specific DNA-methyltransferase
MLKNNKNKYGQYFTPKIVAEFMVSLLRSDKTKKVLEPSCGEGVFLDVLKYKGFKNIDAIEYDADLIKESAFQIKQGNYLELDLTNTYDAIIGNPPYIRWKNLPLALRKNLDTSIVWSTYGNSLTDYSSIFIAKAIIDLKENGELVFITPEYWLYTFHSQKIRNLMLEYGFVESIYYFDEMNIFDTVVSSLIIFRFVKTKKNISSATVYRVKSKFIKTEDAFNDLRDKVYTNYFDVYQTAEFRKNARWSLEKEEISKKLDFLEKSCESNKSDLFDISYVTIGDTFNIANGMVSGLDKAFQIDENTLNSRELKNTIKVAKEKDLDGIKSKIFTTYIFIQEVVSSQKELISNFPNFHKKLNEYKELLVKRYDYKKGGNYWDWSFLRNFSALSQNAEKIFIPCKERIGNKNHFRFTIVGKNVYPTQDVTALIKNEDTKESIYYCHQYLLQPIVFDWISNRGVMRGTVAEFSEAPLKSIPFRKINWNKSDEVEIHDQIVSLAKKMKSFEGKEKKKIEELFNKLIK